FPVVDAAPRLVAGAVRLYSGPIGRAGAARMDLQRRMMTLRSAKTRRLRELCLALSALSLLGAGPAGDDPRLADYFGFLPLEVYKIENRITGLTVRDLDGD